MSRKTLLNEAQIRQFMKLAHLEPLTPGFVAGIEEGTKKGEESKAGGRAWESPTKGQKITQGPDKGEKAEEDPSKGEKKKGGGRAYMKEEAEDELEEVRTGVGPTPNLQSSRRGHGRGRTGEDRLEEAEPAGPEALEDYAAGDVERGEPGEAEEDEFEAGAEEGDLEGDLEGAAEGPVESVDVSDFLAALETALESVLGDEVEIDADEMGAEEAEADVDLDAGEGEGDLDLGAEEAELVEHITRRVAARLLKAALKK